MIYMLKWFGIVMELQWLLIDVDSIYVGICWIDMKLSYIRNDKWLTSIVPTCMKVIYDGSVDWYMTEKCKGVIEWLCYISIFVHCI